MHQKSADRKRPASNHKDALELEVGKKRQFALDQGLKAFMQEILCKRDLSPRKPLCKLRIQPVFPEEIGLIQPGHHFRHDAAENPFCTGIVTDGKDEFLKLHDGIMQLGEIALAFTYTFVTFDDVSGDR